MSLIYKIIFAFLLVGCFHSIGSSSPSRCEANPASYDFQVGDIKVTIISDGKLILSTRDVYTTVPIAVERSYAKSFLPFSPFIFDNNVLYLRTPSHQILIDTGSSNTLQPTVGRLIKNMEDARIRRQDIDAIILSHAHLDHLGGLLLPDGSAAFPNATIYIDKEEYQFWITNPVNISSRFPPEVQELVASITQNILGAVKDKIRTFRDGERIFPEILAIQTPGHTPGHSCFIVESKDQSLFVGADLALQKPMINNPEWESVPDTNSTLAVEQRYRIFDMLSESEMLVHLFHAPWPGLGRIQPLQAAYDWIPASGVFRTGVRKKC